jgi:hypothetical protein
MKSLVMGIHSNVKAGDLAKVKKYLNEGKDPNKEDKVIYTTPFPAHLSLSLSLEWGDSALSCLSLESPRGGGVLIRKRSVFRVSE